MAEILGDLLLRIKGDAGEGKQAIDDTQEGISGLISPANVAKGALMAAAGGVAYMGSQMVPLNQKLDRTATLTDMNSDELRDLAGELTDVTFPLNEVTEGMEMLAQRGVDNREDMERLLPVLDDISDSLGIDIAQATDKAEGFMRAMGGSIEDLDEDSAELIFSLETLTEQGIAPLERVLRRNRDEFEDLGLAGEELAQVMVGLERNTSSSREASQVFSDALEEAQGDQEAFRRIIESTTGDLGGYEEEVSRASGSMEEHAEINTRNIGILERVQHRVTELAFQYGEQLEAVREVSMGLMAFIPVADRAVSGLRQMADVNFTRVIPSLKGVVAGIKAKALALKASAIPAIKAFFIALAPVLPIILAISAAIGAGILIWQEFGDEIEMIMIAIGAAIDETIRDLPDWFREQWEKIRDFTVETWEAVFDYLAELPDRAYNWGRNIMSSLAQGIRDLASAPIDAVREAGRSIRDGVADVLGIGSPSRVMVEFGESIGEGLEKGIAGSVPDIDGAVADAGPRGEPIKAGDSIRNIFNMDIDYNVTDRDTAEAANDDLVEKLKERGIEGAFR